MMATGLLLFTVLATATPVPAGSASGPAPAWADSLDPLGTLAAITRSAYL